MNAELLADKLLLAEMGARYCDACDQKDWDAALALFATDAHLDASAVYGKTFDGHEQIREFCARLPGASCNGLLLRARQRQAGDCAAQDVNTVQAQHLHR